MSKRYHSADYADEYVEAKDFDTAVAALKEIADLLSYDDTNGQMYVGYAARKARAALDALGAKWEE